MDVDENVLVDLYLLGSDVGPFWWQGLAGTSVSIGCFERDWNRRLRCGTIMVARIRRNFYQYRMLWERRELKGVRGKGIAGGVFLSLSLLPLSVGLRCGIFVVARIRRNFCQYGMWRGIVHSRTD